MSTLIAKQFAMWDVMNFPTVEIRQNGKVYRNRRLIASPYTTGENILVLQTTFFGQEDGKLIDEETLAGRAHTHKYAEEIMIFDKEAQVIVDGDIYTVPEGGALICKAGVSHGIQFMDPKSDGTVTCIFVPSIPADEDPDYVGLIQKTKEYLAGSDVVRL